MLPTLEIVQNAYVVRNLEEACARFHRLLGVGPFVGGAESELAGHLYRGQPVDPLRIRVAFAQSGTLNIELIQVVSAAPSAFHDMFPPGMEGFHHQAAFCVDFEAQRDALAAGGIPGRQ